MECRKCKGELEVKKMCSRVRLTCRSCQHEYQIHEVASELDDKTAEVLARYNTIIYD